MLPLIAQSASGPFVELPRGWAMSRVGGLDREQRPSPRDALELGVALRGEFDLRPDHEILDGAGDEHFACTGQPAYARGDMNGDTADIAVEQLAFASVKTRTDLQPELGKSVADRGGAADAARWAVEGREEAVTGALDLASAEALEFSADDSVVAFE